MNDLIKKGAGEGRFWDVLVYFAGFSVFCGPEFQNQGLDAGCPDFKSPSKIEIRANPRQPDSDSLPLSGFPVLILQTGVAAANWDWL